LYLFFTQSLFCGICTMSDIPNDAACEKRVYADTRRGAAATELLHSNGLQGIYPVGRDNQGEN
jgi:hypothetical protein